MTATRLTVEAFFRRFWRRVTAHPFLTKRFHLFVKDQYSHIRIQYRTPTQLGLTERFHQTLKEEEVYYHVYENPGEARKSIKNFRERYNTDRPHCALIPEGGGDPLTPFEVYAKGNRTQIPRWQKWAEQAK